MPKPPSNRDPRQPALYRVRINCARKKIGYQDIIIEFHKLSEVKKYLCKRFPRLDSCDLMFVEEREFSPSGPLDLWFVQRIFHPMIPANFEKI